MFKLNAPRTAVAIGLLLIVVGVLGRLLSGTSSVTALIPLFFGLPIAVLGWFSQDGKRARTMMIIIAVLAGLGLFGTFRVVPELFAGPALSASFLSRGSMFVLCVVMLAVSVKAAVGKA